MVRNCAYPGCLNLFKKIRLRSQPRSERERLTFHRFPTFDPYRLESWLLALQLDTNTPMRKLKAWRICSDHFSPDDFRVTLGGQIWLKSTAVPIVYSGSEHTQDDPSELQSCKEENIDEETSSQGAGIALEDVGQSTLEQQMNIAVETALAQQAKLHKKYFLLLRNPQLLKYGPYFPLPSVQTYNSDEPSINHEEEPDGLDLHVNIPSSDPPSQMDASFFPPSSTSDSTMTTKTEKEDDEQSCIKRKWTTDESTVMRLFRRCQECGALITKTKQVESGSLISVHWECERRHKGQGKFSLR
ncbi:uncharacterized protein [Misgurnus anguillicaudatus]|uniref:uncharacterized protein n=1 Tax=Misgurnus anguillicaudatus TaxID=75329 RepID=UPI003CCF7A52